MFPLVDGCVGMPMPATVLGIFDKDNNELNYGEIGELCMTGPSIMLHYAGWMGEEMTERTLITHDDGKCWLHTGDIAVRVPGVQDGFFCIVPDKEHEGFFVPYLFIILDGSKTLDEVKAGLKEALEDYEYPVDIRVIEERPYFHFKTNRKELTEAILAENN